MPGPISAISGGEWAEYSVAARPTASPGAGIVPDTLGKTSNVSLHA